MPKTEPPSDMFVDHMGVEICARCNGPYWIKHTGSVMPGIGVPCGCDEARRKAITDDTTRRTNREIMRNVVARKKGESDGQG